jgi:hypothetical protein
MRTVLARAPAPWVGRCPSRDGKPRSRAPSVLGIRLDRWQQRGLNRALAYDAALQLVHRHYLLSAARQNGKTVGVRAWSAGR